ncbi:MAG: AAA family ATPase [Planctomycetia bacterium]|nr:AAA family ATPase [Planctomycetia bacterium]
MKLEQVQLTSFRGIHQMTLDFQPRMNVLVGLNGAGKSSVLDAVAILLTRVVSLIRSGKNSGKNIAESDISAGLPFSHILAILSDSGQKYAWSLHRTLPHGKKNPDWEQLPPETLPLRRYTASIREEIEKTLEKCNIPILVYYRAERVALNFPRFVHTDRKFTLLSVFEDALSSKADYRVLLEWFRERENAEDREIKQLILEQNGSPIQTEINPLDYRDKSLEVVRQAWQAFMPGFSHFTIQVNPLRLEATKNGIPFRVDQLSDGEKSLLALVGDIARRLAIANPQLENPLLGEGIILIDEIDLHFHPQRQQMIVPKLMETFPNCQFVVATHSPQILGNVYADSIFLLVEDEDGIIQLRRPEESYGMTTDQILEDVMHVPAREESEEKKLLQVFELIERRKLAEAKKLIEEIRTYRKSEPKLLAADARIQCLETLGKPQPNALRKPSIP